jgi:glycosyltransferase involved in cell wall biosynthesis
VLKISIITVCFNSAVTIRDTIESVLSQNYKNIEYVIIDGGSTDGTQGIVNEYGKDIASFISEQDGGIYDAMNKGIQVSTGDIVGLLNADDFYADDNVVTRLIERMVSAEADCVFSDLLVVDPDNTKRVLRYYDSSKFRVSRLRFGWMPAHPTFFVKRQFYIDYGGYALDYEIASDFEMMVRLFVVAEIKYTYLSACVVKMRAGGISTSGFRSSWLLNKEIVQACKKNGVKTNLFLVLLKVPFKVLELVRKPK